tara:strand:+ start:14098 stop:14667 length:570 start_codon:yes stop_codon:yes gene_type:complete
MNLFKKQKCCAIMLRLIFTSILLFGGLAWGILGLTGYNIISRIATTLGLPIVTRIIYSIIGLATIFYIYKFMNITTLDPSKDKTLLPASLLNIGQLPADFDRSVELNAPMGSKYLAFWTTDTDDSRHDFDKESDNWGVSEVKNGFAEIRVKSPSARNNFDPENYDSSTVRVYYRWVGVNHLGKVNTINM